MNRHLIVISLQNLDTILFRGNQMDCARFIQKQKYEHGRKLIMAISKSWKDPFRIICRPFLWE